MLKAKGGSVLAAKGRKKRKEKWRATPGFHDLSRERAQRGGAGTQAFRAKNAKAAKARKVQVFSFQQKGKSGKEFSRKRTGMWFVNGKFAKNHFFGVE